MPAAPGNEYAYEHALTMRAWARDALNTGRVMVLTFSGVALLEGWLWLQTEHAAFVLAVLASLVLVLLGSWLCIRHGRNVDQWQAALDRLDNERRDRFIHAGRITAAHLVTGRITRGTITASPAHTEKELS
jgi:ABC-type nickel/cobalt efflux system permease component RcnA